MAANDVVLWDGTCTGMVAVLRWLFVGNVSETRLPALFRRQTKWSFIESLLAVDVIVIVVAAGQAEDVHYFHFMAYFLLLLSVGTCRACCSFFILFSHSSIRESPVVGGTVQSGPLDAWARWYVTSAFFAASKLLVVTNFTGLVHLAFFIVAALQSKQQHEANVALLSLFVPLIVATWSLSKNLLFCLDNWKAHHALAQRSSEDNLETEEAAAKRRAAEAKLLFKKLVESLYGDLDEKLKSTTTCLICLEEFAAPDRVVVLPCQHVFHKSCARSWLHRETRCPLRCAINGLPSSPRCDA